MAYLLITGGSGFIGSHTCLALLEVGHKLVVIDDYSNSSSEALKRVVHLAGADINKQLYLIQGDIRKAKDLDRAFSIAGDPIEGVIHFAGLKAVNQSIKEPLNYWDVNVNGSIQLIKAMKRHGCRTIVFSSSATVYGYPSISPIKETSTVNPINPYGVTKVAVEDLLQDLALSENNWRIACLRYFNPVGAHPTGCIGEAPNGIPDNLFPYLTQVIVGQHPELKIFGGDWPTKDGTPVRDYIHVMDLAEGHIAAFDFLRNESPQLVTMNLGSGQGYSVLEVVKSFEEVIGKAVPYRIVPRRNGDSAFSIADPSFAASCMGWKTSRSLLEMSKDAWAWQENNPFGYQ